MRLKINDPVDAQGKIRPIADTDYVGQPVVAHIVALECGMYVFHGVECVHCDSLSDAMGYIEQVRKMG